MNLLPSSTRYIFLWIQSAHLLIFVKSNVPKNDVQIFFTKFETEMMEPTWKSDLLPTGVSMWGDLSRQCPLTYQIFALTMPCPRPHLNPPQLSRGILLRGIPAISSNWKAARRETLELKLAAHFELQVECQSAGECQSDTLLICCVKLGQKIITVLSWDTPMAAYYPTWFLKGLSKRYKLSCSIPVMLISSEYKFPDFTLMEYNFLELPLSNSKLEARVQLRRWFTYEIIILVLKSFNRIRRFYL